MAQAVFGLLKNGPEFSVSTCYEQKAYATPAASSMTFRASEAGGREQDLMLFAVRIRSRVPEVE